MVEKDGVRLWRIEWVEKKTGEFKSIRRMGVEMDE